LPEHIERFGILAGYEHHGEEAAEDVNFKATELLAGLHDALKANGYVGHQLRVFLVRILFVLFPGDTGVWERGLFHDYVGLKTATDGHDLGPALIFLFETLDTPDARRPGQLDVDLTAMRYINGGLFHETLRAPSCDAEMRRRLLACCAFNWTKISPAIFGSLFQNVMQDAARREIGAHYTTEQNILRTIRPLFLDELEAGLAAAKTGQQLRDFRQLLADMTFFDPACGCGNFLVIAYGEIRRLEKECLLRLRDVEARRRTRRAGGEGQAGFDVTWESVVRVGQFYGIEIEEFPARIAETAMHLMDHLANLDLSEALGDYQVRFPINDTAHIIVHNALQLDWHDVLPVCTYLFGNPPFVGKQHRDPQQQADMGAVFGSTAGVGVLDYVAAWYRKATEYIAGTKTRVAFVSTNSIVQGEQVPALWPALINKGIVIDFAHRTFNWTSEARGKAHVHVVIIGFSHGGQAVNRLLYDHADLDENEAAPLVVSDINPYLVNAPTVVAARRRTALVDVPACRFGNMPNDGGSLIVSKQEAAEIRTSDATAYRYIRPLVGAEEMLNGERRYCLWLEQTAPADLRASPELRRRIAAVRRYREASRRPATRALATTPSLFGEIRQPKGDYLCLPRHSSENRRYIPMRFYSASDIAHDSTLTVEGADLLLFGVLASDMFMTWVRTVAGRLESRFRLSTELVYNTFPWPEAAGTVLKRIEAGAQAVLDERAESEGTLADLYHPSSMPLKLVRAHANLDKAVIAAYGRRRPSTELDKQAILFERYQDLLGQLPHRTTQP